MKLYLFESGERDWIAADTEEAAVDIYKREYGLSDRDVADVKIGEVSDPSLIDVLPDDWDYESEDYPPTAADVMATMKAPGLVCSTCH